MAHSELGSAMHAEMLYLRTEIKRLQNDLDAAQAALVKVGKDKSDSEETMARLQRENAAVHLEVNRIGREYAVLGSDRDQLKAKLAAAEVDTERLDYLIESGATVTSNEARTEYWAWFPQNLTIKCPKRKDARAAIDAAKAEAHPDGLCGHIGCDCYERQMIKE